jgi:DnaK suppressor protein
VYADQNLASIPPKKKLVVFCQLFTASFSQCKTAHLIKSSFSEMCLMPTTKENKPLGLLALAGLEPYQESANEEYMNEDQMEHFRLILKAWRDQLREEVDRTVSHMKDEAANFPDPVDRAAQEEEFSLELRTRDRERKLIKKIEKTLKRIEDDDFGFCDSCGIEIGIRRLEARPTADLCIDCKTMAEIKEKQMQG